jgi:alkylated DNA repair protein alkB family protein 1
LNTESTTIFTPGLVLIPGYLSVAEQLAQLTSSLSEYTCPPNPLSLTTHYVLPRDGQESLFSLYVSEPETLIPSIASTLAEEDSPPNTSSSSSSKRELIENEPAVSEGYDKILNIVSEWKGDEPSMKLKSKTVRKLVETELRWANLGWVYNVRPGPLVHVLCS